MSVEDPAVVLLRDLVAIDSVNPSLSAGSRGEADVARRIAGELDSIGLHVEISDAAPGRPNVVGVLDGRSPGRSLMFCGHTDTVGAATANVGLGLRRANVVRVRLIEAGLDGSAITVTSHGEATLLIPTADDVSEPRNRRVDITVR